MATTRFVDEGPNATLPGQRFGLQVHLPALVDEKSAFQHLEIYQSVSYGKVLVLDGVVQLTERDEFAYHEMIAHVPLLALQANYPSSTDGGLRVLLIGAGDGGALREICKHKRVSHVTHIEIDQLVVSACRQHLPNVSRGAFEDARVELKICDGLDYLSKTYGGGSSASSPVLYDLCIVDSGDPSEGPNGVLYQEDFYRLVRRCLHPQRGMLCFQSEHVWLHTDLIRTLHQRCSSIFAKCAYYSTQVPSYPGGQIGFLLCSVDPQCDFTKTNKEEEEWVRSSLRYYSSEVHRASFALPRFFLRALNDEQ